MHPQRAVASLEHGDDVTACIAVDRGCCPGQKGANEVVDLDKGLFDLSTLDGFERVQLEGSALVMGMNTSPLRQVGFLREFTLQVRLNKQNILLNILRPQSW